MENPVNLNTISSKIIFGLMVTVSLFSAQLNSIAQVYQPGYFIDLGGDTNRVQFATNPNNIGMEFQIKFLDENGNKGKITPKDALEIYFQRNKKPVKMISLDNTPGFPSPYNLSGLKVFLMVDIEGYLSLFEYHYNDVSVRITGGYATPSAKLVKQYLLKKDGDNLFLIKNKEELLKYLSDCPGVMISSKRKTLKPDEIKNLVKAYNEACGE